MARSVSAPTVPTPPSRTAAGAPSATASTAASRSGGASAPHASEDAALTREHGHPTEGGHARQVGVLLGVNRRKRAQRDSAVGPHGHRCRFELVDDDSPRGLLGTRREVATQAHQYRVGSELAEPGELGLLPPALTPSHGSLSPPPGRRG